MRMTERSKAPDSSLATCLTSQGIWAFWSTYGGVGSNPATPYKIVKTILLAISLKMLGWPSGIRRQT